MKEWDNPWNINSIYEFQYFNCPTCSYKNQSKQEFVNHAYRDHPDSVVYLSNVFDVESFRDIVCPWDIPESKFEIPVECQIKTEKICVDTENDNLEVFVDKETYETEIPDVKPDSFEEFNEISDDFVSFHDDTENKDFIEKIDNDEEQNLEVSSLDQGELRRRPIHKCDTCGKAFGYPSLLNIHVRAVHEGVKNHKCDTCGKSFGKKYNLEIHIRNVHDGEKIHHCETCGKAFGNLQGLQRHINSFHLHIKTVHEREKNHKNIKKYECDTCGKVFGYPAKLQRHIKTVHEGIKDYHCDKCGKSYGSVDSLNKHISIFHEGIKNHQCPKCDFKSGHKSSLKLHIEQVHEGMKKYTCEKCDKAFSTKQSLEVHISSIHEGQSYKCDICGKNLSTYKYLKIHIKAHEDGFKDTIKCEKCDKHFKSVQIMKAHISVVHEKEQKCQCDACGQVLCSLSIV